MTSPCSLVAVAVERHSLAWLHAAMVRCIQTSYLGMVQADSSTSSGVDKWAHTAHQVQTLFGPCPSTCEHAWELES